MKFLSYSLVIVCALASSSIPSSAQLLQPGDQLPDILIKNILNHSSQELRLSEYKNKLLIFDFWNTRCGACIASFKHLDSLQEEFGNKIQIFLVNKESKKTIKEFFENRRNLKQPKIPFITTDTILSKYFPYNYNPWIVWVDENRVTRYITEGGALNATNINSFLSGKDIQASQLQYISTGELKKQKELYKGWLKSFEYLSGIRLYRQDLSTNGTNIIDTLDGKTRYSIGPVTIKSLFKKAYIQDETKFEGDFINSIVFDQNNIQLNDEELFVYDIILPNARSNDIRLLMRKDLERYFQLNGRIEKRPVKCFSLVRTSMDDALLSKGGKSIDSMYLNKSSTVNADLKVPFLRNIPFEELYNRLKAWVGYGYGLQLINKTGYTSRVDIQLNLNEENISDIKLFRRELNNYGLDIIEDYAIREVLVLNRK